MEPIDRITVYLRCSVCGKVVQRTVTAYQYGRIGRVVRYRPLPRGSYQCPNGCGKFGSSEMSVMTELRKAGYGKSTVARIMSELRLEREQNPGIKQLVCVTHNERKTVPEDNEESGMAGLGALFG